MKGLSAPAQTTLIKWGAVVIIVIVVLAFIKLMWSRLLQNPFLAIVLIIGILVLVLGGRFVIGKMRISK